MRAKFPLLLFALGLLVGAVLFIPFRIFSSQIEQALYAQTRIEAQLGDLSLGTGLRLGPLKGGLLALRGRNTNVYFPDGRSLQCNSFTLSPHLWTFLIGRLQLGVGCDKGKAGEIVAVVKLSPFWKPSSVHVDLSVEGVDLKGFESFTAMPGLVGRLEGQATVSMPLVVGLVRLPDISWDLKGKEVTLPAFSHPLITLPALPVDTLSSKGLLKNNRIDVQAFQVGTAKAPIEASLQGNVTMDPRGMPTGADLKGTLRTESTFEKTTLQGLNLDLIFGKVKESGKREFRKVAQGSLLGLMMNPPIDGT